MATTRVRVLPEAKLWDVRQAAAYCAVPVGQVREAIRSGALAHYVIGKHVRLERPDLDEWLATRRRV